MGMLLYIDPGTGSMLFTIVLGIITTAVFFLRTLVIKLKFVISGGKVDRVTAGDKMSIVIFNEGRQYWNVFKPICDEFERRKIIVDYWTAAQDDPALLTNYRYIKTRFIGEGNAAYAKLNMMSADICLATTPGLDVYQWKRSKNVKYYVHILHAVGSAAGYRMFGLDFYDAVLLSGAFQIDEIRSLESMRNLPPKDLVIVGCPYLDSLLYRLNKVKHHPIERDGVPTVLLAPSWGASSILNKYGNRMIDSLITTGYNIIIRPHPQSSISEAEMLKALRSEYPDSDGLSWDFSHDNFNSLNSADIMITDFSGVMFDYTLVFDKPIMYTDTSAFNPAPYDACWLNHPLWKFSVYPTLGYELKDEDFPNLKMIINQMLNSSELQSGRENARNEVWQHMGESAVKTVDYLVEKLALL